MELTVKTPVYEGPMELLLELIEKRKLLINDIALAHVADEYIARMRTMSELPVEETAEFVALAATLLLIKSRSLLPNLALSEEESRNIKELQYRLAVYQIVKEAAKGLGAALRYSPPLYEGANVEFPPLFVPDESLTSANLHHTAEALIEGFFVPKALPKAEVQKMVTIEEMIERLSSRVSAALSLSFREFAGTAREHSEVIVGFLALLELVKQGIIRATQERPYGDIVLEPGAPATPTYE